VPIPSKRMLDLNGRIFGRLLVIAYAGSREWRTYWTCRCLACGSVRDYLTNNLRSGRSTQCHHCPARPPTRRGGNSQRPGYKQWKRITQTGQACERWLSFEQFIADMGEPPEGVPYLLRIDPTARFQPGCCIWSATKSRRLLTHNGRTMSLTDWARELGLSHTAIYLRLKTMPIHEALVTPARKPHAVRPAVALASSVGG
jgi:hypothetical protein